MRSNLAAFRITSRRISVAVFADERLDFSGSRQLPSQTPKAMDSASRYVEWIKRNFRIEAVALEKSPLDTQRPDSQLHREITGQFRDSGVPIFEVEKDVLLASFAHPPLRYRTQLRKIISSISPVLASNDTHDSCLDAAALGLYVQVERLLQPKDQ